MQDKSKYTNSLSVEEISAHSGFPRIFQDLGEPDINYRVI